MPPRNFNMPKIGQHLCRLTRLRFMPQPMKRRIINSIKQLLAWREVSFIHFKIVFWKDSVIVNGAVSNMRLNKLLDVVSVVVHVNVVVVCLLKWRC